MKKGAFIYLLPIAVLLFSNWSSRASTAELLSNANFEAGNISWTANTLSGSAAAGILQGSYPHTPGTWYGYVGNTTSSVGSLFQSFLVPYNAGIATVTFYLNVGSSETAIVSKYDLMDVNFRTYPSDSLIWKFETFSNLDKAANGVYTKREYTYDLTSYRNQYVVLQFYGVNDADYITTFRIDDVSVSVDLVPAPQTPTGFSASATSSTITLSWNDGSGESDYEIHWATSSSGPWTLLGLAGQNGVTYQDNRASAGVNYWYRIRARSAVGNSAWSSSISAALDRPPIVVTLAASPIGSHSATLNSTINPRGVSTSGFFQYGTTASYSDITPITTDLTGSGDQPFNGTISGLTANTVYHFRVGSINVLGQSAYGSDLTFRTATDTPAPIARISGERYPVPGYAYNYDGGGSSGSGLSFAWSTGDGQIVNGNSQAHFAFNSTGLKYITLIVTDSTGRTDDYIFEVNVQPSNNGTASGQTTGADPVVLSSGNYIYEHIDLRLPGKGFPFEFKRFYNSKFSDQSGFPMGFGWTHNFNERIKTTTTNALYIKGDGSTWTFFTNNGGYYGEKGMFDSLVHHANNTWSLIDKAQTIRLFDTDGKLLSITDKNGNSQSLNYEGTTLTQITDTVGRTILINTNALGLISEIVDPIGRHIRFEYDQTNLVHVIDAKGQTNRFTYNGNHQIENAFDARGALYLHNDYNPTNFAVFRQHDAFTNWTFFTYNFDNRITYQTNASGKLSIYQFDHRLLTTNIVDEATNHQTFAYDDDRNRIYIRDKNGNETRYGYDERGNVTNKVDALTNVTAIEYNTLNNPIRRVDALTNETTFGYDDRGNLTSTTNALKYVSQVQYYPDGLPFILTDARSFSTTNYYDPQGNLRAFVDAKGFTNRFEYDDVGRRVRQIDALDRTNHFHFDDNDNLLYTVNALGFTNSFTYDGNNSRTALLDSRLALTTNVFDLKDRLIAVTDALMHTVSNRYDALDRKVESIDARTNSTLYGYDDVGNLVAVTNALLEVTRFNYDANGNQTAVVDPAYHTNRFYHDALNRRTLTVDALNQTNATGYDAVGRVTATTNANDQTTFFFYDAIGRLTNVVDTASKPVFFGYDENGNRTHTTDPNGHTWTNVFDELNRLVEQRDPLGNATFLNYDPVGNLTNKVTPNGDSINYSYDPLNRLTNIAYPTGLPVTFAYDAVGNRTNMTDSLGSTVWQFDNLNRLLNVTDPFGQTVANDYDENGNRRLLTYPGSKVVHYGYDVLNRMTALTNWLDGVVTYTYDARGVLNQATNANGTTVAYGYDDVNRLVTLTNTRPDSSVIAAYALGLDPIGNHQHATNNQPLFPILLNQTNSYAYDSDNRLTNWNDLTISSDANGNLTNLGPHTLAYDFEDRLIQVVLSNRSGVCAYNGLGNRLQRTVGEQSTRFVLDRASALTQVLVETHTNGSPTAFYIYGLGLAQRITPEGTVTTYHFDVRGSTVALTDSGGNVTDAYAFDSFGVLANADGDSSQPFRYLGRHGIMDDGNGLYHARARYFSPQLGRFLTKDPLTGKDSDGQSLNRYVYALNNPIRFADISGFSPKDSLQNQGPPFPGIVIQWTIVIGGDAHGWVHTFLRITPTDQERYANDSRFMLDEQGKRFLTIGAGPGGLSLQRLVSNLNRERDILPHDTSILLPAGTLYATEDALIDELLRLDSLYRDKADYDWFPRNRADTVILRANDGYNSNSYTSGLIEAAGLSRPQISGVLRVTGWDKPLPAEYFQ